MQNNKLYRFQVRRFDTGVSVLCFDEEGEPMTYDSYSLACDAYRRIEKAITDVYVWDSDKNQYCTPKQL